MKRNLCRRGAALLTALAISAVMTLSSCAQSKFREPEKTEPSAADTVYGNAPVNIYFDNTEASYLINKNDNITPKFFAAVMNTSLKDSAQYALEVKDGEYFFYDLKDSKKESNRILEEAYKDDEDFYIKNSNEDMKRKSGIVRMLYTEANPFFNKDSVSVVFTDLSEPKIDETAQYIKENILNGREYSACLVAISLAIRHDKMVPFYIWTTNNSIIPVREDTIQGLNERSYYLLITGPAPDLSAYVQNLKSGLETRGFKETGDEMAMGPQEYNITDFDYFDFAFVNKKNLEVEANMIDQANAPREGAAEQPQEEVDPLEQYTVRLDLDKKVDDDTYHFIYNKDHTGKLGKHQGYKGADSYDFSLNADLKVDIPGYRTVYLDMDDDKNVIEPPPEDNTEPEDIGEEDLPIAYYMYGDIEVSYACGGKWVEMDENRRERFFKLLRTKGSRLTVISDNTDEEGIDCVMLRVPVYQVIKAYNSPKNWVEKRSFDSDDEIAGVSKQYRLTPSLRYFYSALFGIDHVYKNSKKEYDFKPAIVGYVNIKITGIA